jgi:hypothetical protein
MPGDTVMTQRSGMFLLARKEAHQQGAADSTNRMDQLWYNQPGYTAVCGYAAANHNERVGWGARAACARGAASPHKVRLSRGSQ